MRSWLRLNSSTNGMWHHTCQLRVQKALVYSAGPHAAQQCFDATADGNTSRCRFNSLGLFTCPVCRGLAVLQQETKFRRADTKSRALVFCTTKGGLAV